MTFYPISRSRHFWKSNVVQTKLVLPDRKLYPAYWMVVCLVTLTDLQTHRAGLSASAELLVACEWHTGLMQYCIVRSTESVDCGSTTYIYFRSFHNAKPVPPDAKSLWRHCAWKLSYSANLKYDCNHCMSTFVSFGDSYFEDSTTSVLL